MLRLQRFARVWHLGCVWFLVLLASCQSSTTKDQSTSSDVSSSSTVEPFFLRKLAPDDSASAAKPMLADSTLEPDEANPITPCEDRDFALRDLSAESVSMSYQDVDSAIEVLTAMGYTTRIVGGEKQNVTPGERFSCPDLPVVMLNAETDDSKMTFFTEGYDASAAQTNPYQGGVSIAGLNRIERSHSGDIDRFMVFYHPDQSHAFTRLQDHINYVVDAPAPQVYIEGWVLEVSEEDSLELGLNYSRNIGENALLSVGNLDGSDDTVVDYNSDNRVDVNGDLLFNPSIGILRQVRALVETGKAEILSRPSLLTMSNRQAVIQIVDVIQYPEVETTYQGLSNVTSGVTFGSLNVGITLNLRPKVSADRQWVSLEIDATVDAEDEENRGQAYQASPSAPDDRVVIAEKPGFSSRRVRTFARIPDRTPIIVGGLVTKEESEIKKRVPGLGSIPLVGGLFGYTDKDTTQREIMIVLTPYVLDEAGAGVRSNAPKESDLFDDSNMSLFEDRYRLRDDDLFDLTPITENSNYLAHLFAARQAVRADPELINDPHYAAFLNGNIPGGEALVGRTFFDLVQRLELYKELDLDTVSVSLRSGDQLTRTSLGRVLDEAGDTPVILRIDSSSVTGVYAEIGVFPGSSSAGTIQINNSDDADRFAKSAIAREIIALNGGMANLKVRHLQAGQFVDLPDFGEGSDISVDSETIQVYEASSQYEQIVGASLQEAYEELDQSK